MINGRLIESDDWVVAYKDETCVGSRQWDTSLCGGGICDVPVMGDDGTSGTNGYMLSGEIPDFKVFDFSEGELIDMDFYNFYPNSEDFGWLNLKILSLSELINQDYSFNNDGNFENTATMFATFTDDNYQMGSGDILVGYLDNDEVRSIRIAEDNSMAEGYIFISSIFLNELINDLGFKYYNYDNKLIFDIYQSFDVDINNHFGSAPNPILLSINDNLNISETDNIIDEYSIISAYPNPFNPIINIDINLQYNDYLDISIFDINGQEIDKIFEGYKVSGEYSYKWDASHISSGIYFVVTKKLGDSDVFMEKICLIK